MAKRKKKKSPSSPQPAISPVPTHELAWQGIILALLALLPFITPKAVPSPLLGQTLIYAICAGFIAPFWLWSLWTKRLTLRKEPLLLLLGFLLITTFWSGLFSLVTVRSFWGAYRYGADGFSYFALLTLLAAIVMSAKPGIPFFRRLAAVFSAQAAIVIIDLYLEARSLPGDIVRPTTLLANSNYALSYFLLVTPIIFYGAIEWLRTKAWLRGSLLALVGIGGLVSLWYVTPEDFRATLSKQRESEPVSAIVSPAPEQDSQTAQASAQPLGNTALFLANSSNTERFEQWRIAREAGNSDKWSGVGAGAGRASFFTFTHELPNWNHLYASDLPHNETLQYYQQQGIPGLIAYLALWLGVLYVSIQTFRRESAWSYRFFVIAAGVSTALNLTFNQFSFTVPVTGLIAFTLAASITHSPARKPFSEISTRIIGSLFTVFFLITGFWAWRFYAAERAIFRANSSAPLQIAYEESATALRRFPFEPMYYRVHGGYAFGYYWALRGTDPVTAKAYGEEAVHNLEKAKQINPYPPRTNLSLAAFEIFVDPSPGEKEQALDDLFEALEISPWDKANYHFIQGILTQLIRDPSVTVANDELEILKKKYEKHFNEPLPD